MASDTTRHASHVVPPPTALACIVHTALSTEYSYAYRVRAVRIATLRHVQADHLTLSSSLLRTRLWNFCQSHVSRVSGACQNLQQSAQHSQPSSQTKQQHRTAKLSYDVSREFVIFLTVPILVPGSQASAVLLLWCLLHGRRSLLITHLYVASVCCSYIHEKQSRTCC
jgi:hypothetical protein